MWIHEKNECHWPISWWSDNDDTLLGISGLYKITLKPFIFLLYLIFCVQRNGCKLRPMLKTPNKLGPCFLPLSISVTWVSCGEGWLVILIDGAVRNCHLTELVFSVEYSRFERKNFFHQLFCCGEEQIDPPCPLTCACSESMKTNADNKYGGSAGKSVEWWRR